MSNVNKEMNDMFEKMLDEQAKQLAKEKAEGNGEEEAETKRSFRETLVGFKDYITSARFKFKCFDESRKIGCSYKIVRNHYVHTVLEKIADVLGLTISISSEILLYAVEFINKLICSVVNLAVSICKKIIQIFTLNCGSATC